MVSVSLASGPWRRLYMVYSWVQGMGRDLGCYEVPRLGSE